MKYLIGLVILTCSSAFAQTNGNVWQTVFTDKITTGASANVKNNGQNQHLLLVVVTDDGAVACPLGVSGSGGLAPRIKIQLEGSHSTGGPFTPISPLISQANTESAYYGIGFGSFPFVRANIIYFLAGTHCKVNAYYTGSSVTTPATQAIPSPGLGFRHFNTITTASPDKYYLGIQDTVTTGVMVFPVIYGMSIQNGTATNVIEIKEYFESTCTTSLLVTDYTISLAAGEKYVLTPGVVPLFKTQFKGAYLCAVTSGASTTIIDLWGRMESQ